MKNLNELSVAVHANAVEKGFWDKNLSDEHCLMMVITELSEAIEADRIDRHADRFGFDTALACAFQGVVRPDWFMHAYKRCIKNTVEDELADALIRLLDLTGARKYDLNRMLLGLPNMEISFTENLFEICKEIAYYQHSKEARVNHLILRIIALCDHMKIDLNWHVEQKMKYNSFRPAMHLKNY